MSVNIANVLGTLSSFNQFNRIVSISVLPNKFEFIVKNGSEEHDPDYAGSHKKYTPEQKEFDKVIKRASKMNTYKSENLGFRTYRTGLRKITLGYDAALAVLHQSKKDRDGVGLELTKKTSKRTTGGQESPKNAEKR